MRRLRTILERQGTARFGSDYQPATLATRDEAPAVSRAAILRPKLVAPRTFHCLSAPETYAAYLAFYNQKAVVDVLEQKMLSTTPAPHPLQGHPLAAGMVLPHLSGTVAVADRLGYPERHLLLRYKKRGGESRLIPFPFIGDLLLILRDENGLYAINWTIKDTLHAFVRSSFWKDPETLRQRIEIEVMYYQDAGIRTIPVALESVDRDLRNNLRVLFGYSRAVPAIEDGLKAEILKRLQAGLAMNVPPRDTILAMIGQYRLTAQDALIVLHQAIWNRQLRVDLYSPILANRPLKPEKKDVLVEFKNWFER
jgi:hypothetical protein